MKKNKKIEVEDVGWEKAKEVVSKEKKDWYEEYDEAEGLFMGWRKVKNHNVVTFEEFIEWWEKYYRE